jgi:beta-lactamase regulating signal transducer with metallopeptidase domain/Tfp pilus assembly protein PilO
MELHVLLESVHTADWVVNMAFQATVILLISQIARRLCVKCSAPTRSDLCFITMLLLLLLPFGSFVSTSVKGTKIQLMPLTEGSWNPGKTPQDTGETFLNPVDATSRNLGTTPPASPLPDAGNTTAKQKQDVRGEFKSTHAPLFEIRLIHGINLFGVIWFIGTLVMLIRLGHGLTYARTIRSELTRLESPRLRATLYAVMEVFDTKTPPVLYASPLTNTPHTIGVLTPCIVLPVDLCRTATDEELKSILLHEMSHIVHKDQWAGVLQRLITALLWWNPLVYALNTDFSEQREYICDNYAIRHGNPMAFATCLFNLAKYAREFRVLPTALCVAPSKPTLEHRITTILSEGTRRMQTTSKKTTFLFGLIVALVLLGGLIRINWTMAAQEVLVKTATFPFLSDPIQMEFDETQLYLVEKTAIHVVDREDYTLLRTIRPHNLSIQRIDVQTEEIVVTGSHAVIAFDKQRGEKTREYRDDENTLLQVLPLGERWTGLYDEDSSGNLAIAICDSTGEECTEVLDVESPCDRETGKCNYFKTSWGINTSYGRLVTAFDTDFRILIFDKHGRQLSEISRDDQARLPITKDFQEKYANVMKLKDLDDVEFSGHFPVLAFIKVADGKIYAFTYQEHDGKRECFIYNLDGTYLGTRYVPEKHPWPNMNSGPTTIKDGKMYELAREDQHWYLYMSALEPIASMSGSQETLSQEIMFELEEQQKFPALLCNELAQLTTDSDIELTSVQMSGDQMTLKGTAPSNPVLADFMRNLASSALFQNVELQYSRARQVGDQKRRDFQITATLDSSSAAPLEITSQELFLKFLKEKKDIPLLLDQMNASLLDAGLTLRLFQPIEAIPKDGYSEVSAHIEAVGGYQNGMAFIEIIGEMDRFVTLRDIEVHFDEPDATKMSATVVAYSVSEM